MLQSIRIEPPPPQWPGLIESQTPAEFLGAPLAQWRELTRRELLGRSFSRIVATGHQAGFWHPGILAKYLAMDAAAAAMRADAVVELVVDQDVNDLRALRVPALDAQGVLVAQSMPWTYWPERERQSPTGVLPPILAEPGAWELEDGHLFAGAGIYMACRIMGRALLLHRNAASRAEQFALAAAMLREVRFANRRVAAVGADVNDPLRERRFLVPASALTTTSLWREVLARMRADPRAMWEAYNQAVAQSPGAGMLPLEHRPSGGCEVPCWLVTPDRQRHRAFEHDLRRPDAQLLPRALLMTGLVRLALANLFIHGLSGAEYDVVTERWFADWLGCDLSPRAMATATMTLDLDREPVQERELARAKWLIHHLPYNLDRFLDDDAALRERSRLIEEIEAQPRGSVRRRELFDAIRRQQRRLVEDHPDLIESAQTNLRLTERRMHERDLLNDRTWAFPLHAFDAVTELRAKIQAAFNQ